MSKQPLLDSSSELPSDYSTSVVRSHPQAPTPSAPSLSSILTIRPHPNPNGSDDLTFRPRPLGAHGPTPTDSMISIESYHMASSSGLSASIAGATEGGSSIRASSVGGLHRFTIIKPGVKRTSVGSGTRSGNASPTRHIPDGLWNPLDIFFNSSFGAKCDLCTKRIGWKPILECDDCGLKWVYLQCLLMCRD